MFRRRDTKPKSPQQRGRRRRAAATARQKRRRNASGRGNRSPRTTQKENPSRDGMVGGRSREPRSQYCRPGEPAIANHQTRHEVHNQVSRRRAMLLMQGTEVPEHRTGRDAYQKVIFGSLPFLGSVPFSSLNWTPLKRNGTKGRTGGDRHRPKSDQAQTQSDSHKQATGTAPRKHGPEREEVHRNLKRPRLRLRGSGRPRLQIQCRSRPRELFSEQATSDPTPLPPLVTVRAGT